MPVYLHIDMHHGFQSVQLRIHKIVMFYYPSENHLIGISEYDVNRGPLPYRHKVTTLSNLLLDIVYNVLNYFNAFTIYCKMCGHTKANHLFLIFNCTLDARYNNICGCVRFKK